MMYGMYGYSRSNMAIAVFVTLRKIKLQQEEEQKGY
jgi:hypothetical protein